MAIKKCLSYCCFMAINLLFFLEYFVYKIKLVFDPIKLVWVFRNSLYILIHYKNNKLLGYTDTPEVCSGFDHGRLVEWSELPKDVLALIACKLIHINDFIRFGAVSKLCRSVYIEENRSYVVNRQVPMLMLTTELNSDGKTRSFHSLSEKRVCNFQVQLPHDRYCAGSIYGWLVTVSENYENYDVCLFNPFLSVDNEIHLPSLKTLEALNEEDEIFGVHYLQRVALSANPSANRDFVAMAVYGQFGRLAFCKPGDKEWTGLDKTQTLMSSVIYFQNQFFALNLHGTVFNCDLNHPHPISVVAAAPDSYGRVDGTQERYLVELSGDLLLIKRVRDFVSVVESDYDYLTHRFLVFKLDQLEVKWIEVKSLGGHSVFLGGNSPLSLPASEFPGCKPDCIYFTDDYIEVYMNNSLPHVVGPHDMGVFSLEDGTLEPHYQMDGDMIFPPPIWVEPTLQQC